MVILICTMLLFKTKKIAVFFAKLPGKSRKGVLLSVFCHFSKCCLSSCLHTEKYFIWLQLGAGINCFSSEMLSETGK